MKYQTSLKFFKLVFVVLMSLLLLLPFSTVHASQPTDSLFQRATKVYPANKTALVTTNPKGSIEVNYNSSFISVKDIFGGRVDRILWDGSSKTVKIIKNGQEAVLNFSGKTIKPAANQIILPTNWARLEKGKAFISASVLCYIFENNVELFEILGGDTNDKERIEWLNKLAFLNISTTVTQSDDTLQIYISSFNLPPDVEKQKDLGSFGNRALEVYPGSKSILHASKQGKRTVFTYESSFIPVNDIFGGHVEGDQMG
ncbi:hypothetical protein ACFSTH_14925 [Paenibacillus yanchengensis]|uniref:Copper amine oxidase-like N-terminal domain-containing protein n=1 Tax=Paenibacillus yanchengensis TaxID=2035833 RepID=A0ABW4YF08_9BACL